MDVPLPGIYKCKTISGKHISCQGRRYILGWNQEKQEGQVSCKMTCSLKNITCINLSQTFRPLHLSDDAPRNFYLNCGIFKIGPSTNYVAKRRKCNINKKGNDCVALRVKLILYLVLQQSMESLKSYNRAEVNPTYFIFLRFLSCLRTQNTIGLKKILWISRIPFS